MLTSRDDRFSNCRDVDLYVGFMFVTSINQSAGSCRTATIFIMNVILEFILIEENTSIFSLIKIEEK